MQLDPRSTAVLTLDMQVGIISMVQVDESKIKNAAEVVSAARARGVHLLHVGIGFEPGYPEISPKHPRFSSLKEQGLFLKGSPSCEFHPTIYKAGDTIVYKHRVSGFAGNALNMILQAKGIETLVLMGYATSGVVLSTLRLASDLDYKCIVIKDACHDRDEEVHRVLTEKIFANQATVIESRDFR